MKNTQYAVIDRDGFFADTTRLIADIHHELRRAAPRIARQRYFFWLPLVEDALIRVQRRTGHTLSDEDFRALRDYGLYLVGGHGLPACLPR